MVLTMEFLIFGALWTLASCYIGLRLPGRDGAYGVTLKGYYVIED